MYDDDLTHLDEGIRRLKVEYEIFFNGNRKRPPDDVRMRVEKIVKRLAEATDMSFSQRFRYNTLIARFYVYRDLWRRTQQDIESAEERTGAPAALAPTSAAKSSPGPGLREIRVSIRNPEVEVEKVRRLYDELLRMKGNQTKGSPDISYRQFAEYINSQTQSIRKKYQCSSVIFRVALEDTAIKFTAKAAHGPSS